jgi:MFS family permease
MGDYIRQVRGFRRDIKLFLLYNLLTNVGFGVFQLIFNLYLTELRLREDDIGAFSAVQTLAIAAASATMGLMLRRFGIWRCIVGGVTVFLISSFALAFAEQPNLLLVLSVFNGGGLAFLFTATMPFIIDWARPDQRQHVAAISFSAISMAVTVGALLGGFLPDLMPTGDVWAYRWTLVIGTALGTLGLVPLFLMGPARRGKPATDHASAKAAESEGERRQARHDAGTFVLVAGLLALGAGMVIPFYNVYLTTLGASAREVGYVFALGGFVAATVGLAAPAVSRRLGSLRALVLVRLAIVPFYALLILFPGYGLAVVAHLVRQTSISMSWPIDSTFIAEILPPRARAGAFGMRSAAWNVSFSGASLLGGALIVRVGYDITFVSLIVFSILSMALYGLYYGRHPRIRAGEIPSALSRAARLRLEQAASAEPATAAVGPSPAIAGQPTVAGKPRG